ncbi:MAG: hypothetical protein ACLGIR_02175 [Actinomycetes bacterium]
MSHQRPVFTVLLGVLAVTVAACTVTTSGVEEEPAEVLPTVLTESPTPAVTAGPTEVASPDATPTGEGTEALPGESTEGTGGATEAPTETPVSTEPPSPTTASSPVVTRTTIPASPRPARPAPSPTPQATLAAAGVADGQSWTVAEAADGTRSWVDQSTSAARPGGSAAVVAVGLAAPADADPSAGERQARCRAVILSPSGLGLRAEGTITLTLWFGDRARLTTDVPIDLDVRTPRPEIALPAGGTRTATLAAGVPVRCTATFTPGDVNP